MGRLWWKIWLQWSQECEIWDDEKGNFFRLETILEEGERISSGWLKLRQFLDNLKWQWQRGDKNLVCSGGIRPHQSFHQSLHQHLGNVNIWEYVQTSIHSLWYVFQMCLFYNWCHRVVMTLQLCLSWKTSLFFASHSRSSACKGEVGQIKWKWKWQKRPSPPLSAPVPQSSSAPGSSLKCSSNVTEI